MSRRVFSICSSAWGLMIVASLSACGDSECPDGTYKVGNICRRNDAGVTVEEAGVMAASSADAADTGGAAPIPDSGTAVGPAAQTDAAPSQSTGDAQVITVVTVDGGAVNQPAGECDATRPCSAGYSCTSGRCVSACEQTSCDPNATCALAGGQAVCTCNSGFIKQGTGNSATCVRDVACSELRCDPNATCDVGADQLRKCTCKPGFSGSGTTCSAISCERLTIENGTVSGGTSYDQTATYSCATGYQLAAGVGSTSRKCGADMKWTGTAARCDPISCGVPPTVANASVLPTTAVMYSGTATYTCNSNYMLSGNATITCQMNGAWTSRPTCTPLPVCGNNKVEAGEECEPGAAFQDAWRCDRTTCKRTTVYNSCLASQIGQPNSACGSGQVCTYGICATSCSTTSQCPEAPMGFAKACATQTGTCIAGGCRSSGDCAAGVGCVKEPGAANGACRGCSLDEHCQSAICVDHSGNRAPLTATYGRCQ